MRLSARLLPHPVCIGVPSLQLEVMIARGADGLLLDYRVAGDLTALRWPVPAAGFADGLWQHTCFEAFVAEARGRAYREFNLSPGGQWAAYAFHDWRQRADWTPQVALGVQVVRADGVFRLHALLPDALLPGGALCLGLTAVTERLDGQLDYWALTHAGERPDFHARAGFTIELPDAPGARPQGDLSCL
ncbi:MAG: hypothetical protein CGU29_13005 [Candidatus Dactylopiibacterium carminicum]|uniref:DOMON-like domain-containing protein n=1 Tax=Candidatus Dactylopiibacterium carminicum TaxID=857335 RepID=A0A272EPY3_9RHOO|nr:DOMON-like domain-containing protein [Candidatus Dactylopiibacterium carminicum]KAF7598378.1 hypothetical protein BGI27_13640 [Candidatus Dactylopiibacterium carminicum]PAS92121.1 MAG: hypothetical protein CGU29_13005 [Candidatus Dactylopiibacterium carminicum]